MKINNQWVLDKLCYPVMNITTMQHFVALATKEQFDDVAIIHYPKSGIFFRPIVLTNDFVKSSSTWKPDEFYHDLCLILKNGSKRIIYDSEMRGLFSWHLPTMKWGCRKFNMNQLRVIKKAMEEYYGKSGLL